MKLIFTFKITFKFIFYFLAKFQFQLLKNLIIDMEKKGLAKYISDQKKNFENKRLAYIFLDTTTTTSVSKRPQKYFFCNLLLYYKRFPKKKLINHLCQCPVTSEMPYKCSSKGTLEKLSL